MKKRSGLYIFTIIALVAILLAPIAARAAVDDSYTIALLHMDGSNTSTTFTDESGKTWGATGNAQISTAQSEFGGSSAIFDGTGDYINTTNSSDFNFASGDFTIDFWFRSSSTKQLS
jgi:hypothetical protein